MSVGYSRKELGKLHKQFFDERMAKNNENDAYQRSFMSMLKALIDVIDANNQRIEEDVKEIIKKKFEDSKEKEKEKEKDKDKDKGKDKSKDKDK